MILASYVLKVSVGHGSTANILLTDCKYLPKPFTKIHKLGTASSNVDQVPKVVLIQDVQEVQTTL